MLKEREPPNGEKRQSTLETDEGFADTVVLMRARPVRGPESVCIVWGAEWIPEEIVTVQILADVVDV
jgi:hypothetical protein